MEKAKKVAEEVVETPAPKAKKENIELTVKFVTTDIEGIKERVECKSEGADAQEALDNMTDVPKGINQLVTVIAKRGKKVIEKNVAPHIARALFDDKDAYEFEARFRGL